MSASSRPPAVSGSPARSFRFRPRFRALPWLTILTGASLGAWALVAAPPGPARTFALVAGAIGPVLGLLYLRSPAWRLRVEVDEEALFVLRGDELKFRLPFHEIVRAIADPVNKTLILDGGEPGRSLVVPGPGLAAPYRIERREALYDLVVARVPRDRLTLR